MNITTLGTIFGLFFVKCCSYLSFGAAGSAPFLRALSDGIHAEIRVEQRAYHVKIAGLKAEVILLILLRPFSSGMG
jgi:hypothetical protein